MLIKEQSEYGMKTDENGGDTTSNIIKKLINNKE